MIKKYTTLVFIALIILFIPRQVEASHAMGADLTYKCLGNDQYEVTLKFYRDCAGIFPFCASTTISCVNGVCTTTCSSWAVPYVKYKSGNCGITDSIALSPYPAQGARTEVTPICPSLQSTCKNSASQYPGAEEWVYKGVITLPAKCTDWILSVSVNARNAAINTIQSPGSASIYVEAKVDNTLPTCNSSPDFKNYPVPWVCVGKTYCFNHGAVDPDGDSLVYSLVDPMVGNGTPVTFIAPYAATNPLSSSPGLVLDPATGDVCMTPTTLQVAVMAVKVEEFRNGKRIGFVIRDMQIVVADCLNDLPTALGINGSSSYETTVCAGQQICFDIPTSDINAGNVLSVTWNNGIPAGTFTVGSGSTPTAHFCWNTTPGDASTVPYIFTVTVKDDACPYNGSQTFSYSILVKSNCMTLTATPAPNAVCKGKCTDITAVPQGGTANYSYVWDDGSTGTIRNVCPTVTTIYSCTVTDANGLTAVDTAQVVVNNLPIIGISPSSPICAGSSVTLTASGGATYLWTPTGNTTTSISVSPASTTTYNFTGTTAAGCSDSAKVTVTVNPLPIPVISPPVSICQNASATLTASGGGTYSWDSGQAGSSITVTPTTTTNYVVTVTGPGNCTATASTTVTVNPFLTVVMTPTADSICIGGSTTLNANAPGANSWTWYNVTGSTSTVNVNPTTTTTYSVDVGDVNGCKGTGSVTVTVNPLPNVTASAVNPSICIGTGTTLNAGGANTYSWSNSQIGASIPVSPSPAGLYNYTVTGTDLNGCTNTATTSVTVNDLPQVTIIGPQSVCTNTPTTLTASGGIDYTWTPGPLIGSSVTVTPTSSGIYQVLVKDANGCSNTASTNITVSQFLSVTVAPATICAGQSTTLNAVSGGATDYTWSTTETTQSITVSPTTTTTYNVDVSNSFGCNGSTSVQVTVNQLPTVGITASSSICSGQSKTLTASGGSSYSWLASSGQSYSGSSINVSPTIFTTYNLIVTDNNNCSNTASTDVTVNPLPIVTISKDTGFCAGNAVQLTANGGVSYTWNPGMMTGPGVNVNPTATTTYMVNVSDVNGCTGQASVKVTVFDAPLANAGADINLCEGQSSPLHTKGISGQWTYSWSPSNDLSDPTIPSPIFTGMSSNTYILTVSAAGSNCPPASDTVTVNVHPIPSVDAGIDTSIIAGDEVQLVTQPGNKSVTWFPSSNLSCSNCSSPVAQPLHTTIYVLTVIDEYGCRNRDTVVINVEETITLFVPTSFTPYENGGKNPVFRAMGIGVHDFEFYIFNRWGQVVFKTTDLNEGWDGIVKGNQVPDDVYVYLAKAKSITGKAISKTGTVTIVR